MSNKEQRLKKLGCVLKNTCPSSQSIANCPKRVIPLYIEELSSIFERHRIIKSHLIFKNEIKNNYTNNYTVLYSYFFATIYSYIFLHIISPVLIGVLAYILPITLENSFHKAISTLSLLLTGTTLCFISPLILTTLVKTSFLLKNTPPL